MVQALEAPDISQNQDYSPEHLNLQRGHSAMQAVMWKDRDHFSKEAPILSNRHTFHRYLLTRSQVQ